MKWYHLSAAVGVGLLVSGHGYGLFVAPPEAMMRDVGRILYAHVPTAWIALVSYLIAFIASIGALWSGNRGWDATVVAAVEVGVVLTALLLFQGSVWGRPTWGVWWTWDPRLTASLVLLVSFTMVLLIRSLLDRHETRMIVTAVATILSFIDVPIVYFATTIWTKGTHQRPGSPDTVDPEMVFALRTSAFGMLFLALGFIGARRVLALRAAEDEAEAMPEAAPLQL